MYRIVQNERMHLRKWQRNAEQALKTCYWTLGQYDAFAIVEAPDNTAAVALSLGKLGNIRTQTLPAFSAADMNTIIGKMA